MNGIKVENIKFSYGKELILEDVNMEIEAGDFVCLLGQSGCGKSTMLRMMAGLIEPISGRILVGDKIIQGASLDRGVVFQDYSLFPWLTTGKNIMISLQQKYKGESKINLKNKALLHIYNLFRQGLRLLPGAMNCGTLCMFVVVL